MISVPEGGFGDIQAQIDAFPRNAMFAKYQRVFCRRFAELAPDAWSQLAALMPLVTAWSAKPLQSESKAEARTELLQAIDEWASPYGLNAPWILQVGFVTLVVSMQAGLLEEPLPTTLVQAAELELGEVDGMPAARYVPVEVEPFQEFTFSLPSTQLTWDPFLESAAQFRDRVEGHFSAWLRSQLDRTSKWNPVPPTETNAMWVEWLILRRVADVSTHAIAKRYQVTRNAVDEGVHKAAVAMLLPDHRSTPLRLRGAS